MPQDRGSFPRLKGRDKDWRENRRPRKLKKIRKEKKKPVETIFSKRTEDEGG